MCPVGRHKLNPSPLAAQIHSPVRRQLRPSDPALHKRHPFTSLNFLQNTHSCATTTPDDCSRTLHDNEECYNCSCFLLTNFKTSTPDSSSLYFHSFSTSCPHDRFLALSSHTSDFSLFPNTLERKVFSPRAECGH